MGQEATPLSTMTLLDFEFGVTESPSRIKQSDTPRSQLADPEAYGVTASSLVDQGSMDEGHAS